MNKDNLSCRPGTTDAMQRLADENEALRIELTATENLAIKQGEWLQAIVNITKGEPGELDRHSTHDVVESVEALRAERDGLAAHAERLKNHMLGLQQSSDGVSGLHLNGDLATWDELMEGGRFEEWLLPFTETPTQSTAHIRADGAREALERATQSPNFSDTVVRVDLMREIIEQMEDKS